MASVEQCEPGRADGAWYVIAMIYRDGGGGGGGGYFGGEFMGPYGMPPWGGGPPDMPMPMGDRRYVLMQAGVLCLPYYMHSNSLSSRNVCLLFLLDHFFPGQEYKWWI